MVKKSRATNALPAAVARAIHALGHDIAVARKRRRIPQRLMAQRMMVAFATLQRLEKGDEGVSIGVVATALWTLGLIDRLAAVASPDNDTIGKTEELTRLPKRVRSVPRKHDLDF